MLGWLMSAMSLAALKGEASNILDRVKRRAIIAAVLAVVYLAAGIFILIALAVWLSGLVGAIGACAIIAGALIVIGLIVQVVFSLSNNKKTASQSALGISIPGLTAAGAATGSSPAGSSVASMAVVALAGYMLGRQFFK